MKLKLLLATITTALVMPLLSGCVPVVVAAAAGGAAAGSTLAGDNRTMKTMNEDEEATHQTNVRISKDATLSKGTRVTATVFNHDMLLVGQTTSETTKAQIEALVKSVPHVTKIYNQIAVKEPLGALAGMSDASLTSNIKARMVGAQDLKSNQFKIVSEDGVVYLMGLTTREQAERAVQIVRESSGVKRVVTLIRYVN